MKKLISLLLAVSVMAMSTVASAVALRAGGQRNEGTGGTADNNSNYLRDYSNNPGHLAVYRPGDVLTFSNDTTKMYKDDVITFISSKLDADDLNSATVMFIDQVVADSNSPSYSYKIREGVAEGIYKMDIKIGEQELDTFYYGVVNPEVNVAYVDEDETTQAYMQGNTAYYFAAISMDGNFTLNQAGVAEFGFAFGDKTAAFEAAVADAAVDKFDNEGTANWFFTIGITDADANDLPVADGYLGDE